MSSEGIVRLFNQGIYSAAKTALGDTHELPSLPAENFRFLTIQVEGIKCESCAARLKVHLLSIAGVSQIEVHAAEGKVHVVTKAPGVAFEELRRAILDVDGSYSVNLVKEVAHV